MRTIHRLNAWLGLKLIVPLIVLACQKLKIHHANLASFTILFGEIFFLANQKLFSAFWWFFALCILWSTIRCLVDLSDSFSPIQDGVIAGLTKLLCWTTMPIGILLTVLNFSWGTDPSEHINFVLADFLYLVSFYCWNIKDIPPPTAPEPREEEFTSLAGENS